jgi:hypothetical protein
MVRRFLVVTAIAVSLAVIGATALGQQSAPKSAPAAAKETPQTPAAKPATSSDTSKMPLVNVNVVHIKPELLTEWQDFQKNEVIPTLQKAGIKQRTAIATVVGPAFEYVFLTPTTNFADRDAGSPIVKALGEEGARTFGQKNRRFIDSQRTYVVRMRTDLSYQPDANAKLPIGVVSDYSIAAGRAADFESYIKTDMTAAHKQLKTGGFLVYQTLFGGEGNAFVVVTMLPNFAEVDKGPAITRAYGAARAAAIQQKLAGIVTHVERVLTRQVPELSFQSRMTSENR